MRGFIRVACCAVLIGALVPAGAFAAPNAEARDLHRAGVAAKKSTGVSPLGMVLASYVDANEPDDDWPGQMIDDADLPLAQPRALQIAGPDSPEDIDNYTLSATAGTMYTFETTGTLDTIITLYNSETWEVLAWNDDKDSTDVSSLLQWTATAGVSEVVCEISGMAKDGSYGMEISAAPGEVRTASLSRIYGKNRMAGAVVTAKAIYGPGYDKADGSPVTDVIVVCGEDKSIVDSLSAASLAGWWQAPLLMTYSTRLPDETVKAINTIRVGNGGKVNIHVLGGTSVVPAAIYSKLYSLKGRGRIERISAKNRYALSEMVAVRLASLMKADPDVGEYPYEVFVANGENPASFFDALAASGYCYSLNAPLLLTKNTSVPTETKRALQSPAYRNAMINPVSGKKYMPASVLNGIYAYDEDRLTTSSDRYLAAIDIAQWGFYTFAATQDQIVVVNKLADALAAGTYTGATGGVMLYAPVAGPTSVTATFLSDRKSTISYADIFGGEVCISAAGYKKVNTLLNSK